MSLDAFKKAYPVWQKDWNRFAEDALKVSLDDEQKLILRAIQDNRRVSVRSGTARGKDFVSALAAFCFMYLTVFDENWNFNATKVVLTAPTGRQIRNIMIPEVSKLFGKIKNKYPFAGIMFSDGIRFKEPALRDWYMVGFKAADDNVEAWSGIHAPNVMVVATEASGMSQETFNSIEGILQGNSRLVLIFNPNRLVGEAYRSQFSPQYKKFALNDLNAPNVVNGGRLHRGEITEQELKKLLIPGQVDYEWVDEKVKKAGWTTSITPEMVSKEYFDFEWNGSWYRPSDLFKVKVLGEFPKTDNDVLIPLIWIEMAVERWKEWQYNQWTVKDPLRLGADIAGMGRDNTVFASRFGNYCQSVEMQPFSGDTIHMQSAGALANHARKLLSMVFVDTIGEGAGVFSRLKEQGFDNVVSAKASFGANDLTDFTGEYKFCNMRAYMYWAVRDWLNPAFGSQAAIPPNDEMIEELLEHKYKFQSNGRILIEPKEEIHKRLGRSPDNSDALALTFFPDNVSESVDYGDIFH